MLLQCYPRVARTYLCLHNGEEFRIPTSFVDMNMQILCTVQQCAGVAFRFVFSCSLLSILSIYRGHHQPQRQQHQGLQQRHTHQNHVPALSCFFIPLSHQEQEFAAHFNLEKELANEAGKALMKRFKNGFSNCKSMQNNCFISFHFTSWSHLGRFMDFTLLQARIFRCYVFARSSMFVMRGGEQLVPGRTLAFLLRTAFRGLSCNITKSRVWTHTRCILVWICIPSQSAKESKRWSASLPWPWILSLLSFLFSLSQTLILEGSSNLWVESTTRCHSLRSDCLHQIAQNLQLLNHIYIHYHLYST